MGKVLKEAVAAALGVGGNVDTPSANHRLRGLASPGAAIRFGRQAAPFRNGRL